MNSAGPTAIHERHRASGRRPSTATIACPNCGIHQPVEVEYDGDQGYAALHRSKSNMTATRDTAPYPSLPAAFATKTCAASATKPPANAALPSAFIASLLCPTEHPLVSDCANPALSRPIPAAPRAGNSRA